MATYAFIAAEDQNSYHHQYYGILAFSTNNSMGRIKFIEEAEFGLDDPTNRNLCNLIEKLSEGDILIVSELSRLGRSTLEIIGISIEILKKGAAVCAVNGEYDLGYNAKYICIPWLLSVLLEAKKELALARSKEVKNCKVADGTTKLGRPAGSLGVSRLDGHEDEIVKLLGDGVAKSEVARQMNVSRPALHDFIVSRKLLSKI